jgi:hypothetical protein
MTNTSRGIILAILCLFIGYVIGNINKNNNKIDLPEEFNKQTISTDRYNPTLMMVAYDTVDNVYIFEYMDK